MQSNFKRWIVAALPLVMACSINAQGKVTDVSTQAITNGVAVHVGGTDLAEPTTKWDNGALIIGFKADLYGKGKTWQPNKGGLKSISYSGDHGTVNVAVRPAKMNDPRAVRVKDGWLIYFQDGLAEIDPSFQAPPSRAQFSPVNPRDTKSKALVTLNFVDTDIVQIIKALAIQANVNVAMGSDVVGKVTINLDNVPVEEALDLVTTLGGVRYVYANNTYVISSNARFADTMKVIAGRANLNSETRVVPLFSREGSQVKAAILKMVPPSTEKGTYELVLPSEKLDVIQVQSVTPPPSKDGKDSKDGGPGSTQTNTAVAQQSDATKKDDYVVLVGTPGRMDSVEGAVRALDQQICMALGVKVGTSQAKVQRTYEPKGALAADLVKSLVGTDKGYRDVEVLATPGTSISKQAIVLSGRESEVDRVYNMLAELDTVGDPAQSQYEVVNLSYIKPGYAKTEVQQAVPGLKASFLPPPVDPKFGEDYSQQGGQGDANGASANNGGAAGSTGGTTGGGTSGGTGGSTSGSTSGGSSGASGGSGGGSLGSGGTTTGGTVKTSTSSNSIPMKLLLRGTPEQISAAKQYLAMVDLPTKQVAVELRVMELSREDALKVGLDWSALTGGLVKSFDINQALGDNSTPGGVKFGAGGNKWSGTVTGLLDQLTTKNNVLARPSILVSDGVPTNIFVGDEVRYVKSILVSNNNPPTIETDEVDVGVDFNLTARVGGNGNIMLDLNPTLKILQGFTTVPGGGSLPQTSRRSASTQMSIKSGETIAIGGLIQDQDRKVKGGIPILRDLPFIGYLFSRTNNDKVRSEVVFFVTVREVTEADRAGAANPRQAEKDNTNWPGNKDGKKGG